MRLETEEEPSLAASLKKNYSIVKLWQKNTVPKNRPLLSGKPFVAARPNTYRRGPATEDRPGTPGGEFSGHFGGLFSRFGPRIHDATLLCFVGPRDGKPSHDESSYVLVLYLRIFYVFSTSHLSLSSTNCPACSPLLPFRTPTN